MTGSHVSTLLMTSRAQNHIELNIFQIFPALNSKILHFFSIQIMYGLEEKSVSPTGSLTCPEQPVAPFTNMV